MDADSTTSSEINNGSFEEGTKQMKAETEPNSAPVDFNGKLSKKVKKDGKKEKSSKKKQVVVVEDHDDQVGYHFWSIDSNKLYRVTTHICCLNEPKWHDGARLQ